MTNEIRNFVQAAARALLILDLSITKGYAGSIRDWSKEHGLSAAHETRAVAAFAEIGVVGNDLVRFSEDARVQLDSVAPGSKGPMAQHEWQQQVLWVNVDATLRGLNREFQQDRTLPDQPGSLATLLSAMSHSDLPLESCLQALPWPESMQLWDIAGGSGHLSYGISASRNGRIQTTVVDHHAAEPIARQTAERSAVDHRFVGGDILRTLSPALLGLEPERATFLLSRCLHNFSPAIQNDLLRRSWELSKAAVRLVVANPSWDWEYDGVRNPATALFGLYMAVNAYGGGVPARADLDARLRTLGSVGRIEVSPTLDLFVVGTDEEVVERWCADVNRTSSVFSRGAIDLETHFDAFIPAAICTAALSWSLDTHLSTPRGAAELEKFLGMPSFIVESVMAALVAIGLCRRDSNEHFTWLVPVDTTSREHLARFNFCWQQLSREVPGPLSSITSRALVGFL
jgi:hypothetical protein